MTEQLKPCQHLNVTVTHAKGPHCVDCGALLVSVFSGVERAQPAQAETVPSDVVRDAERYRKLRTFHWSEHSMCVVLDPKKSVLLGAICPSGANLDDYLDAAIAQQKGASHD